MLLEPARTAVSGLKHLWLDVGYEGRGKRWAEEILGLSVEVVRKPPKPIPEKVARMWAEEWAKEKAKRSIGKGSYAAARVSGAAEEEVGGGANLLLVRPEQTHEQGLREALR